MCITLASLTTFILRILLALSFLTLSLISGYLLRVSADSTSYFIRPSLPGWPLWPGLRWLRIMCDWNDRWQARLWCYGFSDDDPSFIQNHLRSLFHTSFVSFDTGLHLASFDAVYYSSERIGYLALGTPASQRVEITRRVDDIITYGELFFDEPI